jgi:Kef-type K+ transport system membrane component KefB
MNILLSPEIQYMALVFGLFIVPRALQRFRLPSAVTCLAIGAGLGIGFHVFHGDDTIKLLAALGITTLFLFAGLEIDFGELRRGKKVLLVDVATQSLLLALGAVAIHFIFGLELRAALLFALALFTPSTGFILDSLDGLNLSGDERFWVKSKAIASEFVALAVLFVTIQSSNARTLGVSAVTLAAMVALLPPVFRVFARFIAPYAPNTEFSFLVIIALLCAFITRELGVYYLVGAFVVGVTAVRLRTELPELTSEKLLGAVEFFASFFVPFYFLKAGLHLRAEHFSWEAMAIAGALLAVVLPLRILRVAVHRHKALGESLRVGARVGTAIVPTLVFTIVLAEILEEKFALRPELFGALIMFTVVNTLVPGFVLGLPAPEFETPEERRARQARAAAVPRDAQG